MKPTKTIVLASAALLGVGLSPSWAGPCTDQIAEVQKSLSSMDAGSGPTMGASPQNPSTTASAASNTAPAASGQSGAAAGSSATVPNVSANPAGTQRAGEAPKTDATVAMNAATQNRATSPQDVRSQQQGQPTASQIAQGGAQPSGTSQPQADKMMQANAALERAKTADQQGNSAACSQAVNEAKQFVGNR